MRKDSFVSNQHLLILRVHSISATMDMRDSFAERGLLGFPVLCLLLCSTVSPEEMRNGCCLSVTAFLMAASSAEYRVVF